MKSILTFSAALMLLSGNAFAGDLLCTGGDESLTISMTQDKITVSDGYDELARETKDPDCVYWSNHFACYENGQLMINVPFGLLDGTTPSGTIYIQSDTGDNIDGDNHALLGDAYACAPK